MADLSEDLIKEYQECFSILDKDGDGMLTREEIKNIIIGIQPAMTEDEEEINEFMEEGGVGAKADEAGFRGAIIKKMTLKNSKDDILNAFKVFDTEGTGKIGVAELTQIFKVLGDGLISEEHQKVFFEKCVGDDKDNVHYNDLIEKIVKETYPPSG